MLWCGCLIHLFVINGKNVYYFREKMVVDANWFYVI